jgi:hypothetical protein
VIHELDTSRTMKFKIPRKQHILKFTVTHIFPLYDV